MGFDVTWLPRRCRSTFPCVSATTPCEAPYVNTCQYTIWSRRITGDKSQSSGSANHPHICYRQLPLAMALPTTWLKITALHPQSCALDSNILVPHILIPWHLLRWQVVLQLRRLAQSGEFPPRHNSRHGGAHSFTAMDFIWNTQSPWYRSHAIYFCCDLGCPYV